MNPPAFATVDQVVLAASQLVGLAVLAATLAAVVALGYRWFARERVPVGLALLAGLAGVAVYLNTTTALGQAIDGETDTIEAALFNIGAFLLGGSGAFAGHRIGDAFGRDVIHGEERRAVDEEVSRLVKTVGRVTVVELPEEVGDVVGYDSVSERTRESLSGKQFVFPRTLTLPELEARVISRLKTDYGVGTVDIELAEDGSVEYLAVGSRAAGIGPTLPPATNAVALRADPAFAASTGDVVQVWETDPMRRVLTGELRGVADDVVTVAINSADTPKVDPTRQYRLVTLPVEDRPAREFAALLRAAEETYSSVTVEAGSPLHGLPVGALELTVVGVRREGEEPVTVPSREYVLSPGEMVFAVGVPETLRRLELAAKPLDPALVPDTGTRSTEADRATEPTETAASESQPDAKAETETQPPVAAASEDEHPSPEQPSTSPSESVAGQTNASSFEELKSEYEDGEDWSENEDTDVPIERQVGGTEHSTDGTTVDENQPSEDSGGSTFDELKSEFESGEADWDDGDADEVDGSSTDDESGDEAEFDSSTDGESDLVSLDEAEISFEDDGLDDEFGDDEYDDDDLSSTEMEDDLSSLSFDEGDGDELFEDDSVADDPLFDGDDDLFDEEESDEDVDEESEEGEDDDDDDDESDGGGGGTFAQLKEEFESGEADWEDDISDSPGGDMRLDE